MLGAAGASVYCTGRSSGTQPNESNHASAGRPETIEETAEMVTAEGGTGIPVRVDHAVEDEVVALFERVRREQQRLDVLAIVMTGQPASWTPGSTQCAHCQRSTDSRTSMVPTLTTRLPRRHLSRPRRPTWLPW